MTTLAESRFTPPRPDCPNPEHWTSDDSDSTEHQVTSLVAAYVRALQPELVVETGTAWGQTAKAIGITLKGNRHGRLVSLEIDPERVMASRDRTKGLPVEILQQDSMTYTPDSTVDLLWIDSLFHLRGPELIRYRAYASNRCVIGIHDTGPQHPMRPILDQLVHKSVIEPPLYLPTPRGVAFTRYLW